MDHTSDECLMSCSRQSGAAHLSGSSPSQLSVSVSYFPLFFFVFFFSLLLLAKLPRSKRSARNRRVVGGHSWERALSESSSPFI